jgi:hypothetical protein
MAVALVFIGKSIVIAFAAAITAWLSVALSSVLIGIPVAEQEVLAGVEGARAANPDVWALAFMFALFGNFAVGLPVALLTYFLSARHLIQSPATLAMIAVLAGIMVILASFVLAKADGIVVLGLPGFASAITFALLGWFWIIKPKRKPHNV